MSGFELFEKGGVVMWVLAALSIYALAVVVYKCYQFYSENLFSNKSADGVLTNIKHGNRPEAKKQLQEMAGPLPRIITVALACVENRKMSMKHKEAEITRVGTADLHHLESHMRGLEMAASVAPLLGLLGTVIGLIDSFSKLGIGTARVDPTMLAGGIWVALLTTAAGLTIAIPALAAHSFFDSILEKLRVNMKDASVQVLALEDEYSQAKVAVVEAMESKETMEKQAAQVTAMVKEAKASLDQTPSEAKITAKEASTAKAEPVAVKPVAKGFGLIKPESSDRKKESVEKTSSLIGA